MKVVLVAQVDLAILEFFCSLLLLVVIEIPRLQQCS